MIGEATDSQMRQQAHARKRLDQCGGTTGRDDLGGLVGPVQRVGLRLGLLDREGGLFDIDARGLECRTAVADASSGGSADIYASESIIGDASSGGSIDVYGKPKNVNKDTSSGGSVSIE